MKVSRAIGVLLGTLLIGAGLVGLLLLAIFWFIQFIKFAIGA